jgi:hypothetical protein
VDLEVRSLTLTAITLYFTSVKSFSMKLIKLFFVFTVVVKMLKLFCLLNTTGSIIKAFEYLKAITIKIYTIATI